MIAVALTFDMEHPSREHHGHDSNGRILDVLRDREVRATFFVQGRYARAYPDLARRVVAEGHLLGNHSHHHARLTLLTDDGIRTDAELAHDALVEVTGVDPRPWFRCPFGDGHDDPRVLAALAAAGYTDRWWDVDPYDYVPTTTATDLPVRVAAGVSAYGTGAVVLLHTWPRPTAEGLGAVLDALSGIGAGPVRLDELPS